MSGPTRAHCREALRTRGPEAVATCRAVFEVTGDPIDGGVLATALAPDASNRAEVTRLAERIGDRPGGADAWRAAGDMASDARELAQAAVAYRRALDHRLPADHANRARDATRLLETYSLTNDDTLALEYGSIAYLEATQGGDASVLADVVTSVAGFLYNLGDLPAVEALIRDTAISRDDPNYVHLRNLEAIVNAARDRRQLADLAFRDVIELARARKLTSVERDGHLNRIGIAIKANDAARAAMLLATTRLPPATSRTDTVREVFARARVEDLRGSHAAALALLDSIAGGNSPVWTARIAAYRGRAMARLGRAAEAEPELLKALAYVEKVRSGIGADAMKPWLVRDWRQAFDDLFALYLQQGRLVEALDVTQRATARSFIDGLTSLEPRSSDSTFVRAARRLEGLRSILRSTRLSPATAPDAAASLLARIGARHVVSFYVAEGRLWRIVTRGNRAPEIEDVGRLDELRPALDDFITHLDDPGRARDIGARLFPERALPGRDIVLYVALAPQLVQLPIAALRVADQFLVERNPIAQIPSLAVLAQLAQRSPDSTGALVIGDATNDLPGARTEAAVVATRLGVSPTLGAAAKVGVLATSRVRVLHVATHTRPTSAGPALVLADGLATAGDIVDRGVSAAVVVLTSCASADPLDQDEIGSLANAFLAAGSRAVVAALWSIEDGDAHTFAAHFYAAHGDTMPITATALAQRHMIAAGLPAKAWAVFVAFGDEKATTQETR